MLDKAKKKAMVSNWKERHPEMGVVSVTCKATGEPFFGTTRDTATWFNRHRFQLTMGSHPNKHLQALWNQYGEADFEAAVVSSLEYDNVEDVTPKDLKDLLELCLLEHPEAKKL